VRESRGGEAVSHFRRQLAPIGDQQRANERSIRAERAVDGTPRRGTRAMQQAGSAHHAKRRVLQHDAMIGLHRLATRDHSASLSGVAA
jgi:hypothetical protein